MSMNSSLLHGPPLGPSRHTSLSAALLSAAAADAPFLTFQTRREPEPLDARETLRRVRRTAYTLGRLGVEPGARVLLVMPTSSEFIVSFLAVQWLGAVPVPLAAPMTFGSLDKYLANLHTIAEDCAATHLITTRRIAKAVQGSDAIQAAVVQIEELTETAESNSAEVADPVEPGQYAAFIQYTSGTTGRPKGVVVSHRAIIANAAAIATVLEITGDSVGVSWLPLFHDMGLIGVVLTCLCHPYPVHILKPEQFLIQPDRWLRLVSEKRATITAAPNFAYDLCVKRNRAMPEDLSSLGVALNGAEPVHVTTMDRFADHFAAAGYAPSAMLPAYGMAENTLAVCFSDKHSKPRILHLKRTDFEQDDKIVPVEEGTTPDLRTSVRAVSVGAPVPGVSVRIAANDTDDSGTYPTLAVGQLGEICVRGASLMDGYHNNSEATEAAVRDGWLHTGDRGFVLDGALYITGRQKEMIIKSGRNIHPYDLERVAGDTDGVFQGGVAAFAYTNRERGTEDIVLDVEARGSEQTRPALLKAIRGRILAELGFKVDHIVFHAVGSLPRTTSGKIQRVLCRSRFADSIRQGSST